MHVYTSTVLLVYPVLTNPQMFHLFRRHSSISGTNNIWDTTPLFCSRTIRTKGNSHGEQRVELKPDTAGDIKPTRPLDSRFGYEEKSEDFQQIKRSLKDLMSFLEAHPNT
jgi:hypothetical protein